MNYTSISQSKQLVEAGLDPNTADMNYDTDVHGNIFGPFMLIDKSYKEEHDKYPELTQPCWSLGALIELMPNEISMNKSYLQMNKIGCRYAYRDKNSCIKETIVYTGGCLIEAVYDMILWLLENNYIKKETK